jgi:hypothetical protein
MAKGTAKGSRKNTRRFSTPVQGSRAYISFYKPTWGEIRETVEDVRKKTKKYISATVDKSRARLAEASENASEVEEKLSTTLWDMACDKFHEWNWVDDDGELMGPLPQLELDNLYGDEVQEIFNAVQKMYMMSDEDEKAEGN